MRSPRLRISMPHGAALGCIAALLYCSSMASVQAEENPRIAKLVRTDYLHYYDSCYRYGRCSADDLRRLRDRLQRLDRVSPQPPDSEPLRSIEQRAHVPPTPIDQIRPEYRNSSQLREEWRERAAPAEKD